MSDLHATPTSLAPWLALGVVLLVAAWWLQGRRRQRRFDRARQALTSLHERPIAQLDACVHSVFAYEAVDISPHHAVLWVLLEGTGSQRVPPPSATTCGRWRARPATGCARPATATPACTSASSRSSAWGSPGFTSGDRIPFAVTP